MTGLTKEVLKVMEMCYLTTVVIKILTHNVCHIEYTCQCQLYIWEI